MCALPVRLPWTRPWRPEGIGRPGPGQLCARRTIQFCSELGAVRLCVWVRGHESRVGPVSDIIHMVAAAGNCE